MRLAVLALLCTATLPAQQAFERNGEVIYQEARGNQRNLGTGFNPILMRDGRVAFVRGRKFEYGAKFDCTRSGLKNWVTVYNPQTRAEATLFDRPLPFEREGIQFCTYYQMQISPNGSLLYLVSLVYATSGSLAIVNLTNQSIRYVGGVNEVFVIQSGPHEGELIYQRRTLKKNSDVDSFFAYPYFHARPDGRPIREVSEWERPATYLRKLNGSITQADGSRFP